MLSRVQNRIFSLSRGFSSSSCVRQQPQEVSQGQNDGDGELRPAAAQMGTMMDIGSRSIFSADHDMFREQVTRRIYGGAVKLFLF